MIPISTDFLVARSSVATGMGTVLNLGGSYYTYNSSSTPEEADAKAFYADWAMIGNDLRAVVQQDPPTAAQLELELST
jgi:hypothetical protein